jgi:hypothetical protein
MITWCHRTSETLNAIYSPNSYRIIFKKKLVFFSILYANCLREIVQDCGMVVQQSLPLPCRGEVPTLLTRSGEGERAQVHVRARYFRRVNLQYDPHPGKRNPYGPKGGADPRNLYISLKRSFFSASVSSQNKNPSNGLASETLPLSSCSAQTLLLTP